eukprot:3194829-Pleurochrysis_carterae.AAC.1
MRRAAGQHVRNRTDCAMCGSDGSWTECVRQNKPQRQPVVVLTENRCLSPYHLRCSPCLFFNLPSPLPARVPPLGRAVLSRSAPLLLASSLSLSRSESSPIHYQQASSIKALQARSN